MTTRREFLSSMAVAGLASQPVFRESAMRSLFKANAIAGDRTPEEVADDEAYWAEIQRAFDADRTMINLNNGGCSPTPSHVLEAMIRDLRFTQRAARGAHVAGARAAHRERAHAISRASSDAIPRRWRSRATRPRRTRS